VIDADGSLIDRPIDDDEDEELSLGGLLGALRFTRKLKRVASTRLDKAKVRQVDITKGAPLGVLVKMSLASQR
jgi:hypothetical protein